MPKKNPGEPTAARRTSLLFVAMGFAVIAALSLVVVQSGAIEGLNQSGVLGR